MTEQELQEIKETHERVSKLDYKDNMKLDYFEILKSEGKYANRPLERLHLTDLNKDEEVIIDCYLENVWFGMIDDEYKMLETYSIKKIRTKGFEHPLFPEFHFNWISVDVWNNAKAYITA